LPINVQLMLHGWGETIYHHCVWFRRRLQRLNDRRDGQRGATAVEFALTIPLFFALIFLAIDGGRLVIARSVVSYAAITAARVASVRATTTLSSVTTAANNAAPTTPLSSVVVTFNASTVPVTSDAVFVATKAVTGNTLTVTVQHTFTPVVGSFMGVAGLGSRTLTGRSRVPVE
jgi:Flp pilus assembly protein TadG